uniref:Amyloid-beta A4 precursor protein-binding family A member 3 n=1 Tax=Phallusia mammillata TaxID=59560 RepID=A0A6F9D6S0_9ASCI|nr:amyloid beta A4 precursor protein-binding family A member 1-like [Phallusia mammillata]
MDETDNNTNINEIENDQTTTETVNINETEEAINNNLNIVQQDLSELPESSIDDLSSCSPSNPGDEAFPEDSAQSSVELTEEDNLHGIQPEPVLNVQQQEELCVENEPKLIRESIEVDENGLQEMLIVNGHAETEETELKLSDASTSVQKFSEGEKRFNPFDKVSTEENNDLWKYQDKSLDEIERFSESFSPKGSLPSSPEKQVHKFEENLNPVVDDIWVQQPTVMVEQHHQQFELMPHEQKQQKPITDFSSSVEDVEQAIRDVQITPSSSNIPVDDPWVKIAPTPSTPVESKHTMPTTAIVSDPRPPRNDIKPVEISPHNVPQEHVSQELPPEQTYVRPMFNVAGPCEPEDLIEGIIFTANYLGSTQLQSERNPGKNARMLQAQEAVSRIKAPDGESQPSVEVDLFISTDKVKILNAETQETMMDHTLRSISYIADIGKLLVIMARRKVAKSDDSTEPEMLREPKQQKSNRIICHVFSSQDAHLMAQAIGQAFNVAYQQFLTTNGIEPQTLTRDDYNELLDMQEMYHDDLVHYSKQENVKDVWVEKKKGEAMGIVIVESGWGSIVPTVILANMQHGSPVERCGKLSIGDQIMTVNGTSLVGLPLTTCQSIIKGLRSQSLAHLHIISCPPVVTVLIKRPDLKYQLGFSVQDGIICSLMRGGIAERGGVRVGHRIIEINGQSVVATAHDKIVQQLVSSLGEIQMKTMPATMYRLLTGQEQPIYI